MTTIRRHPAIRGSRWRSICTRLLSVALLRHKIITRIRISTSKIAGVHHQPAITEERESCMWSPHAPRRRSGSVLRRTLGSSSACSRSSRSSLGRSCSTAAQQVPPWGRSPATASRKEGPPKALPTRRLSPGIGRIRGRRSPALEGLCIGVGSGMDRAAASAPATTRAAAAAEAAPCGNSRTSQARSSTTTSTTSRPWSER